MLRKLLPLLPAHQTYVEPFCGSAAVFFGKSPSPVEVLNDLDSGIVGFYRVLREPDTFEAFKRRATLTPCSREEYRDCRDTWISEPDPVKRAWAWFVCARQSFSGHLDQGWSFAVTRSSHGRSDSVSVWLSAIDGLMEVHERLKAAQIEHDDFRRVLETYDTPVTCFYLDPPYLPETRIDGEYAHEMTTDEHGEMIERLLRLKGRVLLSGYRGSTYDPLETAGWERKDFPTFNSSYNRRKAVRHAPARTESVWLNPAAIQGRQLSLFSEGLA